MSTLKLSYKNEVRRITLGSENDPLSYDTVVEQAQTLFPQLLEAADIKLSWNDDENDQIFVSSDAEIAEAVRIMSSGSKGYLRFDIEAKVLGAPFREKQTDLPRAEGAPAAHEGVSCDECGAQSFLGTRFKCSVRNDYDLCSKCEERTRDSLPFPMIKFYVPHKDPSASDIVVSINPRRGGCRGSCDEKKMDRCERKATKMKKHRGIVCNECGLKNFEGARYKCCVRDDFDLCSNCENQKAVQPFPMVKIYSPAQCPNGLSVFSAGGADATIECDINLPHGLEFLRDIFPPRREAHHVQGPWGKATWRERARQESHSAPAPPSGPARHRHVRCNVCGMKPIVGSRFRCTTRPDFDLCENCEALQPQPYPMTKIYYPDQPQPEPPHGPAGFLGALFGQHPDHGPHHHGPHGHRGPHHHGPHGGRGGRGAGHWHARCPPGPRVAAAKAAAERGRQHREGVQVEEAMQREKELRELEEDLLDITIRQSLTASDNDEETAVSTPRQEEQSSSVSVTCDEESKSGEQEDEASLATTAFPAPAAEMKSAPAASKPMARLVRDVTMPDGSKVQPSSVFVKCWRVRNDGPAAWPENCTLVNAGGDQMFPAGTSELRVPVPSASPGEELDISVHLVAPLATGRHVGYFRLQDDANNWFGQRLWSDIRVSEADVPWQVIGSSLTMSVHDDDSEDGEQQVDAPPTSPAHPEQGDGEEATPHSVPAATDEEVTWARELDLLAAMGFTDSEVVIPLLQDVMQTPVGPGSHPNPEGLQTVVLTLLSNQ